MFGKTVEDKPAILEEIRGLRRDIAKLKGEKEAVREEVKLSDEIVSLKKELVDLQIEKGRETEAHEREKREVEHMVGLERKRQEFELKAAKRETEVTVREENLKADRDRFESNVDFLTRRFEKEIETWHEINKEIMLRLPKVDVEKRIEIGVGVSNGNGDAAL